MTTILMSILSGVLGMVIGFTIGIKWSAFRAFRFGKWRIYIFKNAYQNEIYNIIGENNDGNRFAITLNTNGNVEISAIKQR